MFNQDNEEKKLDWMYKGPNSTVDREEYLLGRSVDKTLDQLNEEDKLKQQNLIQPTKSRVEHECIPPSIRDFNKVVQSEQVDLSAKLQEDPLVAIKKREEESRRQFLQNPVQLKKLQKALKAQNAKKNKKKKKKSKQDSDSDLDAKLTEKLLGRKKKKKRKEERDLDTILIHKYEEFKHKLSDQDLRDVLDGKVSDSENSSEDQNSMKKKKRRDSISSDDKGIRKRKNEKKRISSGSEASSDSDSRRKINPSYDSDNSDSTKRKKVNYGLVKSDGTKIPLSRKHFESREKKLETSKTKELPPRVTHKARKMSEEEKERMRREMMRNAAERDKERAQHLRKHREDIEKEKKEQRFDSEFAHNQFIKSTQSGSIESRIRSNLNNIQRSSRDMDKHFSRRH